MNDSTIMKRKGNKRGVWIAVIAALIISAVFGILIYRQIAVNKELEMNAAALQESVDSESEKNDELLAEKGRELTKEEVIEIARQRFGLVFPDEIIFVPSE